MFWPLEIEEIMHKCVLTDTIELLFHLHFKSSMPTLNMEICKTQVTFQ